MKYQNPVLRGFYPDPSACRVGEAFFLVNSSFEFFPGVPIHRSANLVDWQPIGHCLDRKTQLDLSGAGPSLGLFAPTIRHGRGRFYMTVTDVSGAGNIIVDAERAEGPWSDPVRVNQEGIDPSLLFDEDGRVYYATSANKSDGTGGILLSIIEPDSGEILEGPRLISAGSGGRWPEGPHIYKVRGKYLLILAEGGTEYGHMVTALRSDSPWGPYEACPRNPILSHRDDGGNPIQCVGHGDLVEDGEGKWWMVCLGTRPRGGMLHNLGRETFLAPVTWDGEDWPLVGRSGRIFLEMEADLPGPAPLGEEERRIPARGFGSGSGILNGGDVEASRSQRGAPDSRWSTVRAPIPERRVFSEDGQRIRLTGGEETLSESKGTPTFICRRQDEAECSFSIRLEALAPRSEARREPIEAGIAAYYDDSYHYSIFVRLEKDGSGSSRRIVAVRKRVHDIVVESEPIILESASGAVDLRIRGDLDFYRFDLKREDGSWWELGSGRTAGLCTEGTYRMTFTGVQFGPYCVNGRATFSNCEYGPGRP